MMYLVYILSSEKTNKFYIGSTADINDRLQRHNTGRSKATKHGIPWKLVYAEEFNSRSDAMKREYELKSWKSHKRVAQLVSTSRF